MKNKFVALGAAASAAGLLALIVSVVHAQGAPAAQPARPAGSPAGAPGGPPAGGPPVTVEVSRVSSANLVDDVAAVGSIRANESVMLRPEISGRVVKINFREGQRVRKGASLLELDASVLDAEIAQTRAELALARSNAQRTDDLHAKNFVSERARDEALSNLQVIEARLALAQARRDRSVIRAPFDGVVGIRQVAVGDYVREGADLVTIEDSGTVKIDFRLPERYLPQVRSGQKLAVTLDALPGKAIDATVDVIDPQVDANGRSFLVRARAGNAEGLLRNGMFARVRLVLETRNNAILVPEEAVVSAVTPRGNANFVYKVAGDKATRVPVQLGLRREAKVEVRGALTSGDSVVIAGQQKLRGESATVRVLTAEGKPAAPAASAAPAKS
ncbi:MAG TPA: efflux RND transporter periplasmic adaptor subunit [Burkholderiaceae bacterium]|nr:efflux RND transporter periplasmic adaptor subunit [Burkholderiaceae bacterium]